MRVSGAENRDVVFDDTFDAAAQHVVQAACCARARTKERRVTHLGDGVQQYARGSS